VSIRWCGGPLLLPLVSIFGGTLALWWRNPAIAASAAGVAHAVAGALSLGVAASLAMVAPLLYAHDPSASLFAHMLPHCDSVLALCDIALFIVVALAPDWLTGLTVSCVQAAQREGNRCYGEG